MTSENDHEEAILRRRFDAWTFKGMALLIPLVLAISGWAFALQGRIHEIDATQDERGARIVAIEQQIKSLTDFARDPSPRPETRVAMKAMDDRMARVEERINSLHNYILALPIRPAPTPYAPSKRGEADLKEWLEKQL